MHVVYLNVAAAGHVNPSMPVVAELVRRGHKVTYFTEDIHEEMIKSSGAIWRPWRVEGQTRTGLRADLDEAGKKKYLSEGESSGMIMACQLYDGSLVLPGLLEDLKALEPQPSIIIHDPFVGSAPVAAHAMGIPRICLVPFTGPGMLSDSAGNRFAFESKPWVQDPRNAWLKEYGIDVLADGMCMEWYSPTMNLCTTIDDFFTPPQHEGQKERVGKAPFRCIGACVDKDVKTVANSSVKTADGKTADGASDFDEIREAIAAGKKLVYVSLGTIATGPFWEGKFGAMGKEAGIEDLTGKDYCHMVWGACMEAFGKEKDLVVLTSVGGNDDALEGLPEKPDNFVIRKAVKQLEVLEMCSAFVTHGGANSMHEALLHGVPLAVTPIFGDQPTNAENIANAGVGVSFRRPKQTLTVETLRTAVMDMLKEDSEVRKKAQAMKEKLEKAGGAAAACDTIQEVAAKATAEKDATEAKP